MKALLACFLLLLLLQLTTPFWWWIMLVPFVFGVAQARSAANGFNIGAGSAGALWLITCLFQWTTAGRQIAERVTAMFGFTNNTVLLTIATTIVATLAAGFAGAAGFTCKIAWQQRARVEKELG